MKVMKAPSQRFWQFASFDASRDVMPALVAGIHVFESLLVTAAP